MNWKTAILVLVVLLSGVAVLVKIATRLPTPPEHQVFINAQVLTMDAQNRIVEAVSVRGEQIEAVGSSDEIMALVEPGTEVNDLRGRTLMPGFVDAHGHFPGSGLTAVAADLASPPVGEKQTMAEVLAALEEQAKTVEPGGWVFGTGYDDTLLAEQRHPTRAELDAVSTEHPVVAVHVSAHMVVANSMALELAGINADTEDPVGGVIGRREGSREPNGLLEETARMDIMMKLQEMPMFDMYRVLKTAVREYAQVGVTTAQSGGATPGSAMGMLYASKLGIVPQRLVLFAFDDEFAELIAAGEYDPADYATDRVSMPAIKLVADGSIQGYTGYLSHPYHVPYKGDEDYRGYPAIPRDTLIERVKTLHSQGYQLAIHGNGDESIEDILDAFEAAQQAHPVEDPRMILSQSQRAREDQVARMQARGVTPSFFSAHTYYWGDRHRDIFMGPERAAAMSPARWAQDYGLVFSSHLDTPVVPMEPLQAVWSQVFRISHGGDVIGEEQRIDVMSALRAVTIDAAWQVFQEDRIGSLEPGKLADMIVLSGSPLADPMDMRDLRVERTLIGGATIYRRQ